jgi:hypothetical protein
VRCGEADGHLRLGTLVRCQWWSQLGAQAEADTDWGRRAPDVAICWGGTEPGDAGWRAAGATGVRYGVAAGGGAALDTAELQVSRR